ncbi:histidine kinase [Variovorax dokdonensis]|uniref:histidine kinase n=1 Tax=Variovorax dokdonensis TaxID=344883 RepID=A0ABT7NEW7_9BURK|nr:histidine kinase [Variovorax dokdonensis]MDM0046488.1 histidine kinase [Variovorax dokdonensis]
MNHDWRDLGRHYLQVLAFCLAIAAFTTLIWPEDGYWMQLAYSVCIGTFIWLPIELGRFAFLAPGETGWPKGWRGAVLTLVGIAIGFFVGSLLSYALFGGGPLQGFMEGRRNSYVSIVITVTAGIIGSYFFHARGQRAALDARLNAVERDAAEAKLKLLETQLEPHMLFNTLANLRVLIATDPPRAVAMLDRLNSYLRVTLSGSRATSHPLAAEFDRLADYLELMSVRMGERLRYTLDLPDELRDTPVPPLLLQPLVENAIRHGLEPKVEGGEILVRARRVADGALRIEVRDTGVGMQPDPMRHQEGSGFGLSQVRERLATAHGDRGTLRMTTLPEGGTCASVQLPIAVASPAEDSAAASVAAPPILQGNTHAPPP